MGEFQAKTIQLKKRPIGRSEPGGIRISTELGVGALGRMYEKARGGNTTSGMSEMEATAGLLVEGVT